MCVDQPCLSTRTIPKTYQNQYGASRSVNELEWDLPSLNVYYVPVDYERLGESGRIVIKTAAYRQNQKPREAAERARQPEF